MCRCDAGANENAHWSVHEDVQEIDGPFLELEPPSLARGSPEVPFLVSFRTPCALFFDSCSVDVSDIFPGRGRGSPSARKGGVQFWIENPRRGGSSRRGGGRGAGRVSVRNLCGGGGGCGSPQLRPPALAHFGKIETGA